MMTIECLSIYASVMKQNKKKEKILKRILQCIIGLLRFLIQYNQHWVE